MHHELLRHRLSSGSSQCRITSLVTIQNAVSPGVLLHFANKKWTLILRQKWFGKCRNSSLRMLNMAHITLLPNPAVRCAIVANFQGHWRSWNVQHVTTRSGYIGCCMSETGVHRFPVSTRTHTCLQLTVDSLTENAAISPAVINSL